MNLFQPLSFRLRPTLWGTRFRKPATATAARKTDKRTSSGRWCDYLRRCCNSPYHAASIPLVQQKVCPKQHTPLIAQKGCPLSPMLPEWNRFAIKP